MVKTLQQLEAEINLYIHENTSEDITATQTNGILTDIVDSMFANFYSGSSVSSIEPGSNILTGGTNGSPIINVVPSPFFNNITASGTSNSNIILSAGTDLYNIFITQNDGNDITRVQPGSNITTGGTVNNPTINVVDSPSYLNISSSGSSFLNIVTATTLSATTSITTPLIIGGSSTGSSITYKTTTSTGTKGADHIFQVGTNGGTEVMRILNNGTAIIGTSSQFANNKLEVFYSGSTSLGGGNLALGLTSSGDNTYAGFTIRNPSASGQFLSLAFGGSGTTDTRLGLTTANGMFLISNNSGGNFIPSKLAIGITTDAPIYFANNNAVRMTILSGGGNVGIGTTTPIAQLHVNNGITGSTISGGTLYSGSTDVSTLFATPANITLINSQLATKANLSGATFTGQVNATSLSATTISGGTLYSGSTELSLVIQSMINSDETFVQNGSNITTGGTAFKPTVNVVNSPSFQSITASGASSFTTLTATTFISGSTDVSTLFATPANITLINSQLNTKAN